MIELRCAIILVILVNGHGCSTISKLGYEYVAEDDSWLRLHVEPLTWWDARLRCHLEGGQLASPTSSALAVAMKTTISVHRMALRSVFIGVHATISKGDFMTMDGKPLSNISLQWAEGEPNNVNNAEECVAMTGAGEAIDVHCASARPFFCHKDNGKMMVYDCGTTAEGYKRDQRTGSCYKFHRVPRTWHRAAGACAAEGAHLAVVNSETESRVLDELLKQYEPQTFARGTDYNRMVHLGFWDWNEHGEWLTIFGETLEEAGFVSWYENEPNNRGGQEFCGAMVRGGLFNDIPCVDIKIAFICEITPARK